MEFIYRGYLCGIQLSINKASIISPKCQIWHRLYDQSKVLNVDAFHEICENETS